MHQLQLEGIGHLFGTREVISNVTGSLLSGEVGVVSGANGAGKSTLLRIVAGLLRPSFGEVNLHVRGSLISVKALRTQVGYVAPDLTLYKELTGVENLTFFAELRGLLLGYDDLAQLLEAVGLKGRGRDFVGGYSSGMRQRLKYAVALLGMPVVLVLDEPTANLDTDGVERVRQLIGNHRTRGGITLIATNEPDELAWGSPFAELGSAT